MGRILRQTILIIASLTMAFPLLWMILSSMKSSTEIQAHPFVLPANWSFQPFIDAWNQGRFDRHFMNSFLVTGTSVLGVLLAGSMAGFVFARFRLPALPAILILFMVGLLLPVEGLLIPLHRLTGSLGIRQTYLALILPYIALELPISIFLFRTFFLQIPKEIEEAARMDGCNAWQLYWRIFLPMSMQIASVVGIFTFLSLWNEFLLANFLISNDSLKTMPSAFNAFFGHHKANYQLIFAGLSVFILPAVAFYLVLSRAITRSVTAGALKG